MKIWDEKTMNKGQLIAAVAKKDNLSKKDASNAVNATIETIKKNVKESVTLVGFGTFISLSYWTILTNFYNQEYSFSQLLLRDNFFSKINLFLSMKSDQ